MTFILYCDCDCTKANHIGGVGVCKTPRCQCTKYESRPRGKPYKVNPHVDAGLYPLGKITSKAKTEWMQRQGAAKAYYNWRDQ